jgi:hypothetical protein
MHTYRPTTMLLSHIPTTYSMSESYLIDLLSYSIFIPTTLSQVCFLLISVCGWGGYLLTNNYNKINIVLQYTKINYTTCKKPFRIFTHPPTYAIIIASYNKAAERTWGFFCIVPKQQVSESGALFHFLSFP